jgi:phenylacetate-coenzyme A ligase PaaK-like adenylate-forming protein
VRCPCGRPYPLIEGVQGRVEEALEFPAGAGGQIRVQPAVFHSVMDAVPAEGWQLVQEPDRLAVLLAGAPDAFDDDGLAGRLRHELQSRGVVTPQLEVRRLRTIPGPRWERPPSSRRAAEEICNRLRAVCPDAIALHLIACSPGSSPTAPDRTTSH